MTARNTAPKPPVHLRVRQESVVGGTQLVSLCGKRGFDTRLFNVSLAPVTCAACLVLAKIPCNVLEQASKNATIRRKNGK